MPGLTQEQIDEFLDEIEDFETFCREYLKIKDEKGNIVSFMLNAAQRKFYILFLDTIKKGLPLWFIILKARQLGFSTLIQAIIFHFLYLNFNQKALTMGHKIDASNNLFEIYNRFYNYLPDPVKHKLLKSNEKKLSYADMGSENKVDTAGAGEIGRSDTFQVVHLTELAFYPDPKITLLGLMQGSKNANMFFIESTANGFNEFRERWNDAVSGVGDFIPFFISWLEFPPYSRNFANIEEKEQFKKTLGIDPIFNSYDGEENYLIQQYGATLEQLNWRHWAIVNLCNKDVDQFHQEYPTTPEEAFISSGRPVFNPKLIIKNIAKAQKPIKQGNLIPVYDKQIKDKITDVIWEDNQKGYIKIFKEIKFDIGSEFNIYAAGTDVAEGLENGDFSAIKVLDRRTREVVLTWHGHIDPDLLAEEQFKIQLFLKGKIYFCTEMNNHGLTTINTAYKIGVNQYYRVDFRKGIETPKDSLGFKTNVLTKPLIINMLNEQIRENLFTDYERESWEECLTYVRDDKGRMNAQNACFDDRVMSSALMMECDKWMPKYYKEQLNEMQWLDDLIKKKQNKEGKTTVMSL